MNIGKLLFVANSMSSHRFKAINDDGYTLRELLIAASGQQYSVCPTEEQAKQILAEVGIWFVAEEKGVWLNPEREWISTLAPDVKDVRQRVRDLLHRCTEDNIPEGPYRKIVPPSERMKVIWIPLLVFGIDFSFGGCLSS
ncbi:hypothetical protein C0V97_09815 [Asaia sp. W19]|uniref:hypothetical protein n=1 Tax=Asaia TaxID=91914 RepID=UPI000F8E95A0|nr:hypothetical protein [Asaia sp. W19]RUT25744.1 hypothetical protein C0V97_09815 [Asaia sp. W19]